MGRRNRRLIAAKLSLNGLAEGLQQMKTISDLPRLRRALTRGLRIEASTIAADHLHVRMILEPTGRGRRRTIHQHVHHLTTLQVNDDRPVVGALRHAQSSTPATWTAATALLSDRALACFLRPARIVVSLTGIPSRLISRSEGRPPALWPTSRTIPARRAVRRANGAARTRHALGEDAPTTLLVSTPPAPEAGINNDRRSLSG